MLILVIDEILNIELISTYLIKCVYIAFILVPKLYTNQHKGDVHCCGNMWNIFIYFNSPHLFNLK